MVTYFVHDGHLFVYPQLATPTEIADIFKQIRPQAVRAMKEAGAAHAVYGAKNYDPETGNLSEVDIWHPAVTMTDQEFSERIPAYEREHPGCIILAAHARK